MITIKTRRIGAGSYEIDTPSGVYQLNNCPVDAGGWRSKGLPSGPRWMLTYPGQYSADSEFRTKRDAIDNIRANEQWKADQAAVAEEKAAKATRFVIRETGLSGFVVRDTNTELDVAGTSSRYAAQHIIDCLHDGTMQLDQLGRAVAATRSAVES